MVDQTFSTHREAALFLLNSDAKLSRKEGGFLGQIAADPSPLSVKQAEWLAKLLERAGLPPMAKGGAQ
jgi:hypothetical protein